MKTILGIAAIVVGALTACDRSVPPDQADLVLRHGRILTMDSIRPEAQALAGGSS